MKYFVVETTKVNGQFACGITVKDDLNEALMTFHQIRASALANSDVVYNLTAILGEKGMTIAMEHHGDTDSEIQSE